MSPNWLEKLTATPEGMAHFQQERVILDATERICELMKQQGVTRAELAARLNTSKAHVSQMLCGRRNMTLRTLSDIFCALGRSVEIGDRPLSVAAVRPAKEEGVGDSAVTIDSHEPPWKAYRASQTGEVILPFASPGVRPPNGLTPVTEGPRRLAYGGA